MSDLFSISWDFPSVTPPAYLRTVSPELYEQECQRVQAKFTEAVELAEQTFAEELTQLISHLAERLSGTVDGNQLALGASSQSRTVAAFPFRGQRRLRFCKRKLPDSKPKRTKHESAPDLQ